MITNTEVVELIDDNDDLLGYGVLVTRNDQEKMLPEVFGTRSSAYHKAESIAKATAGDAR
jgi:hypothetical protein